MILAMQVPWPEIVGAILVFIGGLALWFKGGKTLPGIALMAASGAYAWFRLIKPLIDSAPGG